MSYDYGIFSAMNPFCSPYPSSLANNEWLQDLHRIGMQILMLTLQ